MKKLAALFLVLLLHIAGCGSPGGSQGDANDPASDGGSDAEQFNAEGEANLG